MLLKPTPSELAVFGTDRMTYGQNVMSDLSTETAEAIGYNSPGSVNNRAVAMIAPFENPTATGRPVISRSEHERWTL